MKISLIYLLGSGRSGTTMLATVLNSHPNIQTIGEMHQFVEHLKHNKPCSCGTFLNECSFWSPAINNLKNKNEIIKSGDYLNKIESHKNILKFLFTTKPNRSYLKVQYSIFDSIKGNIREKWLLDSSKYIARYLLLKKSTEFNIKGIYVIRDVRGVIFSFGKQVQTSKTPLRAIIYYTLINFLGHIVCSLDKNLMKVRYEDFIEAPQTVTNKILKHLNETEPYILPQSFKMPHIIGGNRMKHNKEILLKKDNHWKENVPRLKQCVYYVLTFPLMIINRYKP